MNETDVREEVIAPLLRRLGYRSGTPANVIREQSLRYPRQFLGRKDPKRDPELRGKADYVLEVEEAVRWVIEAKAPDSALGQNEIEQAWSYANHPEVRAVYFVLCNGHRLQVFQTNQGPSSHPLLDVTYEELEPQLEVLANVLSPPAVLKDHPRQEIDVGPPLGEGLRSVTRITNGVISYEHNNIGAPALNEIQVTVADGAVERDEQSRLVAFLRTVSPSRSLQELNERLGLAHFEMVSQDQFLSADPARPTMFTYQDRLIFPKGEEVLDMARWQRLSLPDNVTCDVSAIAKGTLADHVFSGQFTNRLTYQEKTVIVLSGRFSIHLA